MLALSEFTENFNELLESADFQGAEEFLLSALDKVLGQPLEAFVHFQFGRLYMRWNKMTSAIHHLSQAAELAHQRGDQIFTIQVVEELKTAKRKQGAQRP